MTPALTAVELAITEVTKARASIRKKKTKQVSSVDEIDLLKSVSFAWFQTHRPVVTGHGSSPDLAVVDSAYRAIMDATGRHTTRSKYSDSLDHAKKSLVAVRGFVATNLTASSSVGAAHTSDAPPNFAPLASDTNMQAILQRRWNEVQRCVGSGSYLAATVMMGGLLESLLLARINGSPDKSRVFTAKSAPLDKTGKPLPLSDWKLVKMVDVAHELNWVTKSAKDVGNVLRDFRNYIHPHKEYTDGVVILEEDARMFWEVTKSISRHVLASVGKTP
ncbi:MAG: hypothetical protein ABMA01_13295 [Chthoniobacteraceae bacterium]